MSGRPVQVFFWKCCFDLHAFGFASLLWPRNFVCPPFPSSLLLSACAPLPYAASWLRFVSHVTFCLGFAPCRCHTPANLGHTGFFQCFWLACCPSWNKCLVGNCWIHAVRLAFPGLLPCSLWTRQYSFDERPENQPHKWHFLSCLCRGCQPGTFCSAEVGAPSFDLCLLCHRLHFSVISACVVSEFWPSFCPSPLSWVHCGEDYLDVVSYFTLPEMPGGFSLLWICIVIAFWISIVVRQLCRTLQIQNLCRGFCLVLKFCCISWRLELRKVLAFCFVRLLPYANCFRCVLHVRFLSMDFSFFPNAPVSLAFCCLGMIFSFFGGAL